ncbi:V-set and immunoglobulin domain-containing protein 8b isoform X2 [Brachyhypopomus gauderio]|uniref:V-set and immunoglobulin domain-containing protein 8b isoform X2 n=1 Tax=Brachyhypopomus gauderio TaxID=698409 RepID=UPI004041F290
MVKYCNGYRVFLVVIYATAVYFTYAECIQVTSMGPQTIKKAQGENATLGCTYTHSPTDIGQLDVEWSSVSPDMTQKDRPILSYSGGKEYRLGDPDLMSRLKFVGDPSQGDATIFISSLQASDTATYECKVKKPPGIDSRKVTLVVLVRPSMPKCWVDNGEEIGSTVTMRCKSSEGTIPLRYNWIKETGGSLPATAIQNPQTGELLIRNHSQSYTGSYLCEVSNEVGREQCKYSLKAHSPSKAGVIAGAVIGALLLLLLLLLLIWLLICCCQKRRYEKETANEIKEDAAAPESRPSSRLSSLRSVLGYHTHQGLNSPVRNQPYRAASNHSSYTNYNRGPLQGPSSARNYEPPLKYSSKYGYPV